MNISVRIALASAASVALAGCASNGSAPLDVGERIELRGNTISQYGEAWSAGQASMDDGQRMVERSASDKGEAQEQLTEAQGNVVQAQARMREADAAQITGRQMIADGQAQMNRAEEDYAAIRSGPPATPANGDGTGNGTGDN